MANPLITQGTLNRLRASVIFTGFPELNVTAPFLAPEGISLALEGEATTIIRTMTGTVTSPEPVQPITVTIHLLRTNGLADAFKLQQELDTRLGDCIVRPDTDGLSPYMFFNMALQGVDEQSFNGTNAGYTVRLQGYWPINAELWAEAL